MTQPKPEFARLLTEGVYRIRSQEGKSIAIIQDELGYALGRQGGTAIEYWRRGYRPSQLDDLEQLARSLWLRGELDRDWLESFLLHGGHPMPTEFSQRLLTKEAGATAGNSQSEKRDWPQAAMASVVLSEDGRVITDDQNGIHPPLPEFDATFLDKLDAPGGAVHLRDTLYVERDADRLLKHQILRPGSITTIRAPQQSGKSSLLVRGVHHARQQGAHIIHLDLQRIDKNQLTEADTFLHYLARFFARKRGLDYSTVQGVWQDPLTPQDKLTFFMEDALLSQVAQPIVLAIDEADRLLETDFYQAFFALMRSWHNQAAYGGVWERLIIVMVISTEPYLLISDVNQSPFNVGLKLYLEDFTEAQVRDLNRRHHAPVSERDFPQFMSLLHGHPYLTRKALYTMVTKEVSWSELTAVAPSDSGPFGDHLHRLRWLLQNESDLKDAFKQIINNGRCPDEMARFRLLRAGLIKSSGNICTCRCGLYRRYFETRL